MRPRSSEKLVQGLGDVLRSLSAIFAHLEQRRPVPGPQNRKKSQPPELKLAVEEKPVEIRQPCRQGVADTREAIERDFAQAGKTAHGGRLHVYHAGAVGRSP